MKAAARRAPVEVRETRDLRGDLHLSPRGAGARPAEIVGGPEVAQAIQPATQASSSAVQISQPATQASSSAVQAMARFLEEARAILHELEEGQMRMGVSMPPEGSEELRRRMVEEAMGHLRGRSREITDAVEEATAALRRLAGMR
jgi:hypothetical protein